MDPGLVRTLAIFGIDGSGKSALAQCFVRDYADVAVVTCPRYHHAPGAPHAGLSRALDIMNRHGDELGCFEWKALAVYFQLTLYGPVFDRIRSAKPAAWTLSERHPILDSLVYGPLFVRKIQKNFDPEVIEDRLFPALEAEMPGARSLVMNWIESENVRMNRTLAIDAFPLYLRELMAQNPAALLAELPKHFRAMPPDQAVLLDIEIDLALDYLELRGGYRESHENAAGLAVLRDAYHALFKALPKLGVKATLLPVPRGKTTVQLASDVDTLARI